MELEIITTGPNTSGEIRPSIWLNENIIGRSEINKVETAYRIVISIYKKPTSEILTLIEEKRNILEDFINSRLVPIS